MIPLNDHHLYYFYVVAKSGGIAAACRTVLMSQPAVSTQLRQFERAIGCVLFERTGKGLLLTQEGREVLGYAEGIFRLGDELQDSLRRRSGGERVAVRLGVLSGAPRVFCHALVECILRRFPAACIAIRAARDEGVPASDGDGGLNVGRGRAGMKNPARRRGSILLFLVAGSGYEPFGADTANRPDFSRHLKPSRRHGRRQ